MSTAAGAIAAAPAGGEAAPAAAASPTAKPAAAASAKPSPTRARAAAAAAAADAKPDSGQQSDKQQAAAAAAAAEPAPQPAPEPVETGTLFFAGGTDWANLGKTKGGDAAGERAERYPLLPSPVRLRALDGVRVAFVSAGPAACHVVAGDDRGRVWTWGRNDRGQLGHGDYRQQNAPKVVSALESKGVFAVGATAGKQHTVVWAKDGSSWGWGLNAQGQLGIGSISAMAGGTGKKAGVSAGAASEDVRLLPHRVAIDSSVKCAAAGSNFTVWLTRSGKVLSAGHPENGRLGTGTDYMYNTKDSSIKLAYRPQPRPLPPAGDINARTIATIAAGTAHVLAADTEGWLWSWGCGNYGVLGHKVQQDEMKPRRVETFGGRLLLVPGTPLAAGATSSFAIAVGPQLYAWGKLKVSGDCSTCPSQFSDLSGWNIRHMSCGPGTFAVAADSSAIAWGAAIAGELGQGAAGKKSSAFPVKVDALDGCHCLQTAAGVGFTAFLLREPVDARVAGAAPLWSPPAGDVEEAPAAGAAVGDEGAGGAAASGGGKRGRPAGSGKAGSGGSKPSGGAAAKKGKK